MYKIHELRELIKLIDQSSIQEFELEQEDSKISMRKQGKEVVTSMVTPQVQPVVMEQTPVIQAPVVQSAPVVQKAEPEVAPAISVAKDEKKVIDANLHQIKSPMVGTFYRAPAPDADPYVKVGDRVDERTIVCIVEAMKLFNEIEAEVKGEIVEVLVENGQLVEYNQPLFLVKVD
ncbi:acetyl-CoA carboxylase biotin carboxyl carrier protein [Tepidibacillus fermentans]|uniref:Biotin carboxyl carrier protein of acetyl-CoA carboxylase n=1 Tax=Tepidibacillus fermentans TaxID=1281767 RepID=A0A4R3KJS6_9BACI|nr:acetyl-CoA carboxylase biotin carboxyl carrier protein [Tepidibacillus fermentans]TCS84031.1 biotin carboxyl carrier protein [Tepidibacillus fermentans]